MKERTEIERSIGLTGGIGVGAIVGGGILALSGVAFATTGPAGLAFLPKKSCQCDQLFWSAGWSGLPLSWRRYCMLLVLLFLPLT